MRRAALVKHRDLESVDMHVRVGSVELRSPVMTASGTAGYGAELASSFDLASIGAVVTKSLAPFAWDGNPPPRLHPTEQGMLNAVGLQGPGVRYWLEHALPDLVATGATVVASIWGRSVDDYRLAAEMLADAPDEVVAVEVNLSCPNLEGRNAIFAHDPALSAEVVAITGVCGRPRWAKLSANTDRIVEVARAVSDAGAEAVTCVNTMLAMAFDPLTLRPGRRRPVGAGDPPDRSTSRPRCPRRDPRSPDRRRRWRDVRVGCRRVDAGWSVRDPGRHGHVRRPGGTIDGAARSGALGAGERHSTHRSDRRASVNTWQPHLR
jgi:dihydroorotate dehydrogenase subfamily 1